MTLSVKPIPRERGRYDMSGAGGPDGVSFMPPRQKRAAPSARSLRGLDWFTFFVANVQTGFGPFLAVYLTSKAWTQIDIGFVLTIGGLVALAGQIPGGALVDYARSERFVAMVSVGLIAITALALALQPIFPVVLAVQIAHAAASCVLGPALAAISLGLVGHAVIGERLGRNARFASIGNGVSAALMGACGYLISNQAVFFVTAALVLPAIVALTRIKVGEVDPVRAHGGAAEPPPVRFLSGLRRLTHNRALLILAACAMLFHLSNAAMLPLMGGVVTTRSSHWAPVLIAACIVVPQLVVAAFSPWVGHQARVRGRRPLLIIGFGALPIRGLLFAFVANPYVLVLVQVLDGISAAVMAVLIPLVVADVTRGTGRFNLAQGVVGSAVGIGASLSTTLAGYMADRFGNGAAFFGLAVMAAAGLALLWFLMPETRPDEEDDE